MGPEQAKPPGGRTLRRALQEALAGGVRGLSGFLPHPSGALFRAASLRAFVRATLAILLIAPTPAGAAGNAPPPDFVLMAIVLASGALALAAGLWGLSERQKACAARRSLRSVTAKARALIAERDAWLSGTRESLLVWRPRSRTPLSFGKGARLMEACLTGADADQLSAALDALTAEGSPFALTCRTSSGQTVAVRGRPAGGDLVVFLEAETRELAAGVDFKEALNAIPIPAWIRGKDLELTFVNRAFLAAAGLSEEAALAADLAFDKSERELSAAARADGRPVEAKRFALFHGERRALAFTLTPLADGSVAGTAADVTGVGEAESRLKQHIAAETDILDRLQTAVAIFDPDHRLGLFNKAFARLFELPEAWLRTGPPMGDLLDRLRELRRLPEQADFRAWKQARLKQWEAREKSTEDWHLPGGQTLRVTMQPHPAGGLVFLSEDVTSQLALESSFNTLTKVQKATLDNLDEGVAVFGPDGRLKLHNAAFARIWRLEPDDLADEPHLRRIAQSCASRFSGDRTWEIVTASVTATQGSRRRESCEIERADGRIIALNVAPLPDGATLASFADVTDRFRIETALRERSDALEASDRMKSEFVKRMSYELRTPLNSILGFAEMMKEGQAGPLTARQHEYLDAVVHAANGLKDLINDVLDLSQIESGAMTLNLEKLDLHLLLFDLAEHAREWGEKMGLNVVFDCKDEDSRFVGDSRRLKQVVLNLISNALKYTPRGGTVTLGGAIKDEEVQIYVADTGPGVSADFMPTAFDRFSASGAAASRPGAGLGLTLVNRFVELHQGWVELESRPGKGTRVTCHLPRNPSRQKRRSADLYASVS